jgi:hypothetical protein
VSRWATCFCHEGRLEFGDLLRFLPLEPLAVFREFALKGLVQTGLLSLEFLQKLLSGVLHVVCNERKLVRIWLRALPALIPLIKSDLPWCILALSDSKT